MPKLHFDFKPLDPITFLVIRKFPGSAAAKAKSASGQTLSNEDRGTLKAMRDYEIELKALDKEAFDSLLKQEKEAAKLEEAALARKLDLERWYSQAEAEADYEYWSRAAYWHLDEAIALSLGKDPRRVTRQELQAITDYPTPPFVEDYEKRRELASRAINFKQLYDPAVPSLFIRWAKKSNLELPQELEEAVSRNGAQLTDWEAEYEKLLKSHNQMVQEANEKFVEMEQELKSRSKEIERLVGDAEGLNKHDLATRERSSLLKLILVMAVKKYGYLPGTTNEATGTNKNSISSDSEVLGLDIGNRTVRKYLDEAAELFRGQLKPPDKH